MAEEQLVSVDELTPRIYTIRGRRVTLDFDLAGLYGVPTKRLNEQVTRNRERFPDDFMVRLTKSEIEDWRSHFATSNPAFQMGLRRRPRAFTEQGVAMLSTVLRSGRAIQVNIAIMRAFVRMRDMLDANRELEKRLQDLESRFEVHDAEIEAVFDAIRGLMAPTDQGDRRRIGFGLSETTTQDVPSAKPRAK